ncbi:NUDIX hydrolase [Pontiellaceae bacterium B12227]|nr:NUDIX hydrolase [Pontiellaceae bacterium B12227]
MHRNDLLSKLRNYRKRWPAETAMADRLMGFVESNPDCFERSLQIGHVTGSAWVVNKAGTHVLLTHHKKLNMWLQLGGHADGNCNILDAALCEAAEESGFQSLEPASTQIFDIDIHLIPARKTEPAHHHHDIRFVFQCLEEEDYIVSDESHDLAWVEIQSLEKLTTEESMLRMARKWISFRF